MSQSRHTKKYLATEKGKASRARANRKYRAKPEHRAADYVTSRLRKWRFRGITITHQEYEKMFANQQGRCAVCGRLLAMTGSGTHLDHDHGSGRPRGILCRLCNTGIGHLQDSPALLRKAAFYLEAA